MNLAARARFGYGLTMKTELKDGPSIALVASLAGEPARANMLSALLSGKALTGSELAGEAGVTLPTASSHLSKLEDGGLVTSVKQGRHRYFRLAGSDVGDMLETMMSVAARAGHMRTRTGPSDPAMRKARVCYDHLAGEMGVRLYDSLLRDGKIAARDDEVHLTRKGEAFLDKFGVAVETLDAPRRPMCRACLDWSHRRNHLAGQVGAALLARITELEWARRDRQTRTLHFTPQGEIAFNRTFAS
jgi:DNA-binding transcriptional ArsR family regulator